MEALVRLGKLGEPIGVQSILSEFLDRVTLRYEQVVKQLYAEETLTAAKVERVCRTLFESLRSRRSYSSTKGLSASSRPHAPSSYPPAAGVCGRSPPGLN